MLMVTIDLSNEEQALFVEFRRNYEKIAKLITARVFEVKNGSVVLHFDQNGDLRKIDRHDSLYAS